ncbi:hypothetical protein DL764_002749 [Monosporascus ibericus]|uniref:Uncharacterized protein n=1 Tax=Monosporascus ibericus TaxID=155417 RepID=A0A4Q4TKF0_9PEZI|nr:hypothetical protein DL764_002749 [Monosporascus ibericus]
MPPSITGDVLKVVKGLLSPQIIDNRLNPYHLAVATRAYWIQSHILRIPDRFGFFSPSPPRLQVHQSDWLIILVTMFGVLLCTAFFLSGTVALLYRLGERPVPTLLGPMVALTVVTMASLWVLQCFDPRRALDYDWRDWKVRKE